MAFEQYFDWIPGDHTCLLSRHAFFSCRVPGASTNEVAHPVPMFWVAFVELAPKADGQMLKSISHLEKEPALNMQS